MQVILIKEVSNLGQANDVVKVKPGYGRNYLIPQGLARIANKRNLGQLDQFIEQQNAEKNRLTAKFTAIAEKLSGTILKIGAKAGTSGKIFGSVTNIQLAEAIKTQLNEDIDRKTITLLEEVKELGSYTAEAKLYEGVVGKINFEVFAD
jgi:large subunit ribosomal protein L9